MVRKFELWGIYVVSVNSKLFYGLQASVFDAQAVKSNFYARRKNFPSVN